MSTQSKVDQDETNCEAAVQDLESGKGEETSEEIDYMHPDGKPTAADKVMENPSIEEKVEDLKSTQKALEEADGHHVCTDKCQEHHAVAAKGADKS
jgi:hypothetical protein